MRRLVPAQIRAPRRLRASNRVHGLAFVPFLLFCTLLAAGFVRALGLPSVPSDGEPSAAVEPPPGASTALASRP
jgi:hypothetical protein